MSFEAYKPDQAKTSRTLVLLTGVFLIAWGCASLVLALPQFPWIGSELGRAWNEFNMFGGALPDEAIRLDLVIYQSKFSPALTIAAVIFLAGSLWYWRFLNTPKWADLLIEMESELNKVSWPSLGDAWQSTLVVTGFTVVLVGTILVYDLIIRGILQLFSGVA